MIRGALCLAALLAGATPACAALDYGFDGYLDLRLIAPGDQKSTAEGGLGKLRYGKDDSDFQFAALLGQGWVRFTPEVTAVVSLRAAPDQRTPFDPLEAYIRYRPVSTTPWRWSVKAGAFFAPFSLENTELGWSSYWTITPSAINSWFGDELRTIGGEGTLEWRRDDGTLTLMASAFGWNDPAGVMMADRGWSMDDRPTGLFDHLREPDTSVLLIGGVPPDTTPLFKEFDNRAGWYAGASWDDARQWHAEIIHYDNQANSSAHQEDYFAWRTQFWDAGFSARLDDNFTAIAQALAGTTTITPAPVFSSTTDFSSAFALIGWERGQWRLAARVDVFHTRTDTTFGASPFGENGTALTAAVSWLPKDWLRLTGEILSLDSKRAERLVAGMAPDQSETQAQFSARIYF